MVLVWFFSFLFLWKLRSCFHHSVFTKNEFETNFVAFVLDIVVGAAVAIVSSAKLTM